MFTQVSYIKSKNCKGNDCMSELILNVKNREKLIEAIEEELIGPFRKFEEAVDVESEGMEEKSIFYYENHGVFEEVFTEGIPSKKYATGLLYPKRKFSTVEGEIETEAEEEEALAVFAGNKEDNGPIEEVAEETYKNASVDQYRKSTMGMTFAVPSEVSAVEIVFSCGKYEERDNKINSASTNKWWYRKSLYSKVLVDISGKSIVEKNKLLLNEQNGDIVPNSEVSVYTVVRPVFITNEERDIKIVSITIENINNESNNDESILFQCKLEASINNNEFLPYPTASEMNTYISEEDRKFEMLYGKENTYAFGHDCAVHWDYHSEKISEISTTFLPEYEIKTMTPDIIIDGKKLTIHHAEIIKSKTIDEIHSIFDPFINGYKNWFENLKTQDVPTYYKKAKDENILHIEKSIKKMEKGLELLKNKEVFDSFKLANLSMLMQMNMGKDIREISIKDSNVLFHKNYDNPFYKLNYDTFSSLYESVGKKFNKSKEKDFMKSSKWRGFQIAFLLQSLESIVNPESEDRETVDVIWFPTGGGKTEAYLAVSAFSMIYRRLKNPNDYGVDIMMRYTLRMLTADQFQRASRLIVSLEYLRSHFSKELGENEFSVGLWVGGNTTPNNSIAAKKQYTSLINNKSEEEFLVNSCPFCGAEVKVINKKYLGIRFEDGLKIYCPDKNCHFHNHLPIYIVDEDIYKNLPTYVVGTVDKFVQLTWKPEARSIFGLDESGKRIISPPTIIIQDELHLISGSLGTLAGMYEVLIEYLATDLRKNKSIKPKIIAATATTKAYGNQIKALFGREKSLLFPPSGLDINDNFYSTILVDENDDPMPGRKYVGVYTTTQGLLQTQVQIFSSLLIASNEFPEEERDPYWTILSFYNRINDIGKALTLTQQDIPNTMEHFYRKRNSLKRRNYSNLNVKELTSRMHSSSLSREITELKTSYGTRDNINDITLASNIIEVGIDIDRLSLMTIVGQPKTTSQYIQVSGRVGRRVTERPGLVVVMYDNNNSNDKSHYEHFIEYHQKLYAQVEESSITPFSQFALRRGLPAVIIGFIRQAFELKTLGRSPEGMLIEEELEDIMKFVKSIQAKISLVDPGSLKYFKSEVESLINMLIQNNFDRWEHNKHSEGLIIRMSQENSNENNVLAIINSMRSVESESVLSVKNINKESGQFKYEW